MNNEVISDRQGINLLILFMFGSTLVLGTGGQAKNDTWIAILLAVLFSVPVLIVYSRLLSVNQGKDLFDIINIVFGKYIGKLVALLYIWFPFHLGALVLRNFGEFINAVALPETPKIVPMIIYAGLVIYVVKVGIETLSKCADFFVIIAIGLIILFAFLTIPEMDIENLRPILGNGIGPVLQGALTAFSFPFGETVVFIAVLPSLKTRNSSYRVYLTSLIIGGFFVVIVSVRNILVLGADTIAQVYFPSYTAIARVNIGNFFTRLEIAVSTVFLLSGFVKISICLMAACRGVSKLFGYDDYRFTVIPVGLLMVNLSYIVYDNIMEMFEWAFEVWEYYALPFQLFFPLLILIVSEIKLRKKKTQTR